MEIATLQDYLESLRPFTGVAWVSQTAAKFAANSYWATQNYRAVIRPGTRTYGSRCPAGSLKRLVARRGGRDNAVRVD